MVTEEAVTAGALALAKRNNASSHEPFMGISRAVLEAAISASEYHPKTSLSVNATIEQCAKHVEDMFDDDGFPLSNATKIANGIRAISAQVKDDSEIVDCLLAGKTFVFDPATNFCHAGDGGAPERGIKYVPAAQVQEARSADDEETYQIGIRDGYSQAVQEIDRLTGGDGEYRYCTDHDPERHTPGPAEMIQRIADRFETLNLIGDAEKRGDFWDAPGSAQVQDVAELDADEIAAAISTAACELGDVPDPEGDDTISITVRDLEVIAHRHITVAIERAAAPAKQE